MKINASEYTPLRDIDNLKEKNHSMVLYDNEEFGKLVKYRYIENGLKKGEHSICLTHDDINSVEKEMISAGIDVDDFKQKNLLHIHKIDNLMGKNENDMVLGLQNIIRESTAGLKPPFRFIGRIIPNVSTKEGIEAELKLEHFLHSSFENFDCSVLCTYGVNDIEGSRRPIWLSQLLTNHHKLIYAADPANAVTFDPDMLDTFTN